MRLRAMEDGRSWRVCLGDYAGFADLRRAVLRGGRPDGRAVYDFDQDARTSHYAVRDSTGALLGAATVISSICPYYSSASRRLALMAVEARSQGKGIGRSLVLHVLHDERSAGRILWASSRLNALGFYLRMGLMPIGAPYIGAEDLQHQIVIDRPVS